MAPGLSKVVVFAGEQANNIVAAIALPSAGVPLYRQLSGSWSFPGGSTSQPGRRERQTASANTVSWHGPRRTTDGDARSRGRSANLDRSAPPPELLKRIGRPAPRFSTAVYNNPIAVERRSEVDGHGLGL